MVRQVGEKLGPHGGEFRGRSWKKISANGLVGENFFLEHVHPNINGHFVIANSIARALSREAGTGMEQSWDWSRMRPARDYVRRVGYDRQQFIEARYTVGRLLLDFPFFQCDAGENALRRIDRHKVEQNLIKACHHHNSRMSASPVHP